MANQFFFTDCESVKIVGAYSALRSDVSVNLIKGEDLGRFNLINSDEGVIIVSDVVKASLTAAELNAIIAHEQGHIEHRHLQLGKDAKLKGYVNNLSLEFEADAFAAKSVGAETMSSALRAFVKVGLGVMFADHPGGEQRINEAYETVIEKMKPRFDALSAI